MKYKNNTGLRIIVLIAITWHLNSLIPTTKGANILFYFGGSLMYSHRTAIWPLVTSLAEDKGHNVTFSAIFHPKPEHVHPKVKEFFPKEFEDALKQSNVAQLPDFIELRLNYGRIGQQFLTPDVLLKGHEICDLFLSTNETQSWIQNSKFDLIIIDATFSECGYALAYKFNAKTILVSTNSIYSWWYDIFGFPAETNAISELHLSFALPMTFVQRLITTLLTLVHYFAAIWIYCPKMDGLFKEKFNDSNFPTVLELVKNTSLILVNTHYTEEYARSLPPLIIPVGGLHLETGKQVDYKDIPKDMLRFMDESGPNGFIYISFGSKSEISKAPKAFQDIFITAFNNAKARFLWKWEDDDESPVNLPSNVMIAKWMPQRQILAHPSIKSFITHAGIMGLTESINAGVPVIMLPIFAEQDYNAFRFERSGRGIRLEISTITTSKLEAAIQDILTNYTYKQNVLKTRKLYLDRPFSPSQTAIWWTEYVLRNDDFTSLKPLAINQTWYERRLLDVWAFIAGFILIILAIYFYIFKKFITFIFSLTNTKFFLNSKLLFKVKAKLA